jgi:hypothetical protein
MTGSDTRELVAADVELAVLKWCKGNSRINAAVHGQVHFEVPGSTPPFPLLTISSAGGTASVTEALIDESIISFSCWGKPFDKAATARVAAVVRTEAFNLFRSPVSVIAGGASVTLHGAAVGGALWLPDPDAGFARHVVDAVFTTTSRAVA